MNEQTLFLVHIMDGYSFRNTIGIIKSETENATMVLSPEGIEISFMNTSKCAIHNIKLNKKEFTSYSYNIRDEKGDLVDSYPIAFETNEMFNTTKGIGRRDGIRIYWLPGDNKINIQPIKMTAKDPGRAGALFVKILTIEHLRYDVAGTYPVEPNVRVQAKDFSDICSQANTLKCAYLEIIGHANGVTFKGILSNQTVAYINSFVSQTEVNNKPNDNRSSQQDLDMILRNIKHEENTLSGLNLNIIKSEDLMTVKIPISTVKALSKIHNISPTGTLLRFFFSEGKPTKIESPIGTYGLYIICLKNGRS
jgi:hypothetical protein